VKNLGVKESNYYEEDKFMSVSKYKKLKRCEVLGTTPSGDFEPSQAMLIGSYVDAYVEGTLEEFKQEHPEVFLSTTTDSEKDAIDYFKKSVEGNQSHYIDVFPQLFTKSKSLKKNINNKLALKCIRGDNDLHQGMLERFPKMDSPQLKSDFKLAENICNYIDANERISNFLSGEKQVIMTGEIEEIPFKIKMDSYIQGVLIADLKVMRSVTDSNGDYYDFLTSYGYITQLACYQEIVYQNTGERLPVYIVAVTKETPINSVIIQIPQNQLELEMIEVREKLSHLYKVKLGEIEAEGCGKCKACIEARTETELINFEDLLEGY